MTVTDYQIAPDGVLEPCQACGRPCSARSNGRPLHIACGLAALPPSSPKLAPVPAPRAPRPALTQEQEQLAGQLENYVTGLLDMHQGDVDAIQAALDKNAINLVMGLMDATRAQGFLTVLRKPAYPDIMRKPGPKRPDQIWEARPDWTNAAHDKTDGERLDVNAAFLAAFTCHLPIGELQHTAGPEYHPGTAGVHLITPPDWTHTDLPNPIGNREEPGPVWITTATLRLLLRCAKAGLCAAPVIHEQFIAKSSEGLLKPLQAVLSAVRTNALDRGDDLTLYLVKTMYAKFVATIGESRFNHHMRRPDWEHNIRAQAFANLWGRAYKARENGLTAVRIGGTDELRVIGDWRSLWPEGRGLAHMKIKEDE